MGLIRRKKNAEVQRSDAPLGIGGYIDMLNQMTYQGIAYSFPGPGLQYTSPGTKQEQIGSNFMSLAQSAYQASPIVFACMNARAMLFSEARFQYRQFTGGRPGDLFGDKSLAVLENPWPGATTRDLLKRMIIHSDLAGNAFAVLRVSPTGDQFIALLRPDWVSIIIGVRDDPEADIWAPDAEILGYVYAPQGYSYTAPEKIEYFLPEEVAHFAPVIDPTARFRGMSWLTPLIREIMADKAMTDHKLNFLENAATPNLIVKLDVPDLDAFTKWTDKFRKEHEGADNAYKTLFLAAGADATPVGVNMQQLDFTNLLEGGENRIAADAGVPPILVGLSSGLRASTYSNYQQARRHFADHTMRPLWGDICGSLARIIKAPNNSELWYDDRDIPALQDDRKDAALIQQIEATTISSYLAAGFTADSVVASVQANDKNLLKHSGLFSVQLQKPGTPPQKPDTPPNDGTNPPQNNAPSGSGA